MPSRLSVQGKTCIRRRVLNYIWREEVVCLVNGDLWRVEVEWKLTWAAPPVLPPLECRVIKFFYIFSSGLSFKHSHVLPYLELLLVTNEMNWRIRYKVFFSFIGLITTTMTMFHNLSTWRYSVLCGFVILHGDREEKRLRNVIMPFNYYDIAAISHFMFQYFPSRVANILRNEL